MKRILKKTLPVMFALVLISASALSVSAETVKGTVTYDGDAVALNYSTKDIKEALSGLTPGDDVELEFTLKNNSNKATDWYVEDSVIKAFEEGIEETTEGTNGAYEYNLVYTSASGKSTGIYSNEVGGDNSGTTVPKGLKQASSGSEKYFYLDRIGKGKTGTLKLAIAIDGETLGNNYQSAIADLDVNFAVEVPDEDDSTVTTSPKTGDYTQLSIYMALFAMALVLLAAVGIYALHLRRKERKND